MGKQILKGFTMLMFVVGVAFISAVATANGQSVSVRADIPFEFTVGDKALPSGKYTVRSMTATDSALIIRSADATSSAIRLANPVQDNSNKSQARLIFHRYGEKYANSQRRLATTIMRRAPMRRARTKSSKYWQCSVNEIGPARQVASVKSC